MAASKEYGYVGANEIRHVLAENSARVHVHSADDAINWIIETKQPREYDGTVVATFIIDTEGELWINDRHSEHVRCAAGQNVLSAGEMAFEVHGHDIEVVEVTNQSTGYCPEPESWWAVERALDKVHIPHPPDFTMQFLFRRCDICGTTNIVKDLWFECAVCQSPLSDEWNFA